MRLSLLLVLTLVLSACGGLVEHGAQILSSLTPDQLEASRSTADSIIIRLSYNLQEHKTGTEQHLRAINLSLSIEKQEWDLTRAKNHKIRAVLLSSCRISGAKTAFTPYNHQVDIPYNGRGYQVSLGEQMPQAALIPLSGKTTTGTYACQQSVSVVVDGKWLVDPISNSYDFKLKL